MNTQAITKLEAANRQLSLAVRLFLNDGDPVCVHTLACAAREIFEKHLGQRGGKRLFDLFRPSLPGQSETEIWNALNRARNFFKHPGDTLDDELTFSDEDNDLALMIACHDCTELCGDTRPPEVHAFLLWFNVTEPGLGLDHGPMDPVVALFVSNMEQQYPGLRGASREERKRFGRALFSDGCPLM